MSLTLYTFKPSSSSWRVRATLAHFGLLNKVELKEISLVEKQNEKEEYKQINPMGQVPCLVIDNNTTLTQSLAIIEYLNSTYSNVDNQLIPNDNILLAAKIREISEIINSGIQPLHTGSVLKYLPEESRKDFMENWIRKGLTAIEHLLVESHKNKTDKEENVCFPNYGKITLADICLVPQVFVAKTRTSIGVDKEFPVVAKVYQHLMTLDIFTTTKP
ncbi:hypothetical protein ABK040_013427 [Willaertia magna]